MDGSLRLGDSSQIRRPNGTLVGDFGLVSPRRCGSLHRDHDSAPVSDREGDGCQFKVIAGEVPLQFCENATAVNWNFLQERSDVRLGWMGEMVANMRLLKTHAWEHLFGTRLKEIRGRELKHLDNDLLYRSIMSESYVAVLLYNVQSN